MKITGTSWDWKDKPDAEDLNLMLSQVKDGHFIDANMDLGDSYGIIFTDGNMNPDQAGRLLETMAFWDQEIWITDDVEKLALDLEDRDRQNIG